ncbi:hypothetical protein GCM10023189_20790 [Nibrella saemangeumensis]|uniref:Nucleotidyltransferase n=1 Tax=Nibrella saemangeumensis TaxID=1084526 RepID=A0ABP8MUB9_9BACT
MEELLQFVCQSLEKKHIPYMLSGSVAMSMYTIPRFTRDIDIIIVLPPDYLDAFAAIFSRNFYFHRPTVEEEVKRHGLFHVIDLSSGVKLDFIIRKPTEFRLAEFDRRQRRPVFGFDAWVVSAEDLVLSKLIWIQDGEIGLQKTDIENLLRDNPVDWEYIRFWSHRLNLKTYNLL